MGNGAVLIRSLDKIQLGKFHRVVLKRYHRDGILKLDDAEDVAGQAAGSLKALDLLEDTFVGYVPTNHTRYVLYETYYLLAYTAERKSDSIHILSKIM